MLELVLLKNCPIYLILSEFSFIISENTSKILRTPSSLLSLNSTNSFSPNFNILPSTFTLPLLILVTALVISISVSAKSSIDFNAFSNSFPYTHPWTPFRYVLFPPVKNPPLKNSLGNFLVSLFKTQSLYIYLSFLVFKSNGFKYSPSLPLYSLIKLFQLDNSLTNSLPILIEGTFENNIFLLLTKLSICFIEVSFCTDLENLVRGSTCNFLLIWGSFSLTPFSSTFSITVGETCLPNKSTKPSAKPVFLVPLVPLFLPVVGLTNGAKIKSAKSLAVKSLNS